MVWPFPMSNLDRDPTIDLNVSTRGSCSNDRHVHDRMWFAIQLSTYMCANLDRDPTRTVCDSMIGSRSTDQCAVMLTMYRGSPTDVRMVAVGSRSNTRHVWWQNWTAIHQTICTLPEIGSRSTIIHDLMMTLDRDPPTDVRVSGFGSRSNTCCI